MSVFITLANLKRSAVKKTLLFSIFISCRRCHVGVWFFVSAAFFFFIQGVSIQRFNSKKKKPKQKQKQTHTKKPAEKLYLIILGVLEVLGAQSPAALKRNRSSS